MTNEEHQDKVVGSELVEFSDSESGLLGTPPNNVVVDLACPTAGAGDQDFPEMRPYPLVHAPVDAPLCMNCKQLDLEFFDPSCPGCREILNNPETAVAQIFACMRQWVPQTQRNIEGLVEQILKRGAHVDDRDGLTDMTLLHFACKAGASGVGDSASATRAVKFLLSKNADVNLRCKWTQMSSLHYAAYFDAAPIVQLLLETSNNIDINSVCSEYNKGTALHISASNLCLDTTRMLLKCGAKVNIKDGLGRIPKDCIPSAMEFEPIPHVKKTVEELIKLLSAASSNGTCSRNNNYSSGPIEPVSGRALLRSMGLTYGSRVVVANVKTGTLRFCGTTEFAVGLWIGVDLDSPDGKNNGSVNGVIYFKCATNHGIFVPINKINKLGGSALLSRKPSMRSSSASPIVKHNKIDLSKVTSKIETGLSVSRSTGYPKTLDNGPIQEGMFRIGERVLVSRKRKGTVRFYGTTKFASGNWYGIELDSNEGKNDGSIQGVRYFVCSPSRGIFSAPSGVSKLLTSSDDCIAEIQPSSDMSTSMTTSVMRLLSANNAGRNSGELDLKNSSPIKRSPFRTSFRISTPNRSPRSAAARLDMTSLGNSSFTQFSSKQSGWLTEGVNVLVNNELGVVKYIGPVDFADGTWIGVELRQPHGKNSGSVNGKQYFSCKPDHGLLVKPHKVSVHGINGSKLLEQQEPSPIIS